jgi:Tfp pilus assembly protein PilO
MMTRMLRITKDWLPAVAGIGLAIAATVFTVARASEVGANIRQSNNLATALNTTAEGVEQVIMSPEATAALRARRHDIVLRMRDSMKQIVPQISEAARNAGLTILEIAPKIATARQGKSNDPNDYPHYRVMVLGSYQKIAEFMQGCCEQRIPVRVTNFRISQTEDQNFVDPDLLKAEITVEAFRASKASLEQMKEI